MTESTISRELKELRSQLERLSARAEELSGSEREPTSGGAAARAFSLAHEIDSAKLAEKLGEFLKQLGADIRDSKGRALAAAFFAGFIAGRTLGK